jgi:nucleoside-triphosphatase THEP1
MLAREAHMQVIIITGAVDSGKTTYCRTELAASGRAGVRGLLLLKVMEQGMTVGYDAREIGGARSIAFARRLGNEPSGWREVERVGCYSVSRGGKEAANRWLEEALAADPEVLIIDEVGPLETAGGGLAASVRRCLASDRPGLTVYLVVRINWLDQVRACFDLRGARLLSIPRS